MATDANQTTERRPLRVMAGGESADGGLWDGHRILHPGDATYDAAFREAQVLSHLYGVPMPYADEPDEQDAAG